ncbi:MoaD/ThiS family protein [Archaeoglobus veneficus]|uniref:ThiamineS protein n=1 Tax=Archaeoglobus veneficus (strain DSM 11195 / SNP6) TaxID=693661 RepID=F2KPW8_ARCVS|nr:MoaD/ThiS family protein [Archaeoglobus veneficus]AEA46475.1 thiamineS protein [Archaeoglobus veneficus SNP6]
MNTESLLKVKVKFLGFDKKEDVVEVSRGKTYSALLEEMGVNPETVVVIKDGVPVPVDERVEEGEVTIIRVISGG